ncbi:hypothetical protein HMPREF9997_00239 [Corynebacterium durum F0235]|uniref:Uncharacterized protein n=1 Tax=Corynebacterium durum F0235 TaxID=1035195 RepID=L1MMK9_9CORY|nr:hypothetical protein HMPREF9997_00239 [Corynebacterium durum F0235]
MRTGAFEPGTVMGNPYGLVDMVTPHARRDDGNDEFPLCVLVLLRQQSAVREGTLLLHVESSFLIRTQR